jgi:hypothetical protein
MLQDVPGHDVSDRKLGLFKVACCRHIWHLIPGKRARAVVEVAERYADGEATLEEVEAAGNAMLKRKRPTTAEILLEILAELTHEEPAANTDLVAYKCVMAAGGEAADAVPEVQHLDTYDRAAQEEEDDQATLLRDIAGNPFRRVAFTPAWRTPAVTTLARVIYNERRFEDLPILADALEEAGCMNSEILNHCRGPGPHTRGCWVVDAILEKA